MIVCSCNALTESQVRSTLAPQGADGPRSPFEVYTCLGCKPNCGRCTITIRKIMAEMHVHCLVPCPACPAADAEPANDSEPLPFLEAAE